MLCYLNALVPQIHIALVEAVDLALLRDLDILVRQDKLPNHRVQREAVNASANAEHEDGGGAVQAIPGAGQILARLADIDHTLFNELVRVIMSVQGALLAGLIDSPDGSNRDAGVDVG